MSRDIQHIFERLRSGVVPQRGLDAYAVGVEKPRAELQRQLEIAKSGEGAFKFLRGGYGCGKTFMARLAVNDALERNFAASFVVVSDNDLHFYKFDDVYRKVMQELSTAYCGRAALGDILDRWIGRVEEGLLAAGADEDAPDFDQRVVTRLKDDLQSATRGKVPEDMVRVISAIFELKQQGKLSEAGSLLSWLCGSVNVAAKDKARAGVTGNITSKDAMNYLRGVVEIVRAAGYQGLVIVIDEAETILRMRSDVRGKSLNGIRQIIDSAADYPGLLWVFTGTPDFFDTNRGVQGLQPLHDRIKFQRTGDFASLRQPQLELRPFDSERLRNVAIRLRQIYPGSERIAQKVTDAVIDDLVRRVTEGLKGDVGVVPRQFLRQFVDMLDLVEQEEDYDPRDFARLKPAEATLEEQALMQGKPLYEEEPEDAGGYQLVEF